MKMNIEKMVLAIAKGCSTHFGLTPAPIHGDLTRRGSTEFFHMPVDQNFGIFRTIIASAHLRLRVEESKDSNDNPCWWVLVGLHYDHTGGGSNGYTVGHLYINDRYEVVEARKN